MSRFKTLFKSLPKGNVLAQGVTRTSYLSPEEWDDVFEAQTRGVTYRTMFAKVMSTTPPITPFYKSYMAFLSAANYERHRRKRQAARDGVQSSKLVKRLAKAVEQQAPKRGYTKDLSQPRWNKQASEQAVITNPNPLTPSIALEAFRQEGKNFKCELPDAVIILMAPQDGFPGLDWGYSVRFQSLTSDQRAQESHFNYATKEEAYVAAVAMLESFREVAAA